MYDHILNGTLSRRKHQQMISDAARTATVRQHQRANQPTSRRLHPILLTLINLLVR